jgi:hypothetical protein
MTEKIYTLLNGLSDYAVTCVQLSLAINASNHFLTLGYFSNVFENPRFLAITPYGRWNKSASVMLSPAK